MVNLLANKFNKRTVFDIKNLPLIYLVLSGICVGSFLTYSLAIPFFWQTRTPTQLQAEPLKPIASGKPQKIYLANLTGGQVSLVWFSENSGQASVYSGDRRFIDDRGETTVDQVHQITVGGLAPETESQLMVCGNLSCQSGDANWYGVEEKTSQQLNPELITGEKILANGQPIKIKTGKNLDISRQSQKIIYGKIIGLNQPSILSIKLKEPTTDLASLPLITVVDPKAGWAIDLSNSRSKDYQSFFKISDQTGVDFNIVLPSGYEFKKNYLYREIKDNPGELEIKQ